MRRPQVICRIDIRPGHNFCVAPTQATDGTRVGTVDGIQESSAIFGQGVGMVHAGGVEILASIEIGAIKPG